VWSRLCVSCFLCEGIGRTDHARNGLGQKLFMQKTKKSVAKRFKLTATGKLMRRTPGFRHLLAAKSTKSKRRASRDKLVAPGHAKPLKRCLPFGL
jgi:large subunit ribosomal protein L35